MEQLAEYSLFGNIASMKAVRIGNNARDSLILGFKDAKVKKRKLMMKCWLIHFAFVFIT